MSSMTRWKHATAFFNQMVFVRTGTADRSLQTSKISFLQAAMALGGRRIEDLSWSTTYNLPYCLQYSACLEADKRPGE